MWRCPLCKIVRTQWRRTIPALADLCQNCHQLLTPCAPESLPFPTISALEHQGLAKLLTQHFKYRRQLIYGRILTCYLLHRLKTFYHFRQMPDYIIVIPPTDKKLYDRGFSQTHCIGQWLSQTLQRPMLPLLHRIGDPGQQAGLSKTARYQNIRNTFAANLQFQQSLGTGPCIALLDDVITTGATMHEASQTLTATFGALSIHWWSLTQQPLKHDNI